MLKRTEPSAPQPAPSAVLADTFRYSDAEWAEVRSALQRVVPGETPEEAYGVLNNMVTLAAKFYLVQP
jgi:hypothetical protein